MGASALSSLSGCEALSAPLGRSWAIVVPRTCSSPRLGIPPFGADLRLVASKGIDAPTDTLRRSARSRGPRDSELRRDSAGITLAPRFEVRCVGV